MANLGHATNADGLVVQFPGQYERANSPHVNRLRYVASLGAFKYFEMDIDLELVGASATYFPFDLDNDGTGDGFHVGEAYLPAGSSIVRGYFITTEVAAGGTDFTVGQYQLDGDTVDADGIVDATDGAAANMSVVGETIVASGALFTAATSAVTEDSYVAVTTNGTFTAGKCKLVLEVISA